MLDNQRMWFLRRSGKSPPEQDDEIVRADAIVSRAICLFAIVAQADLERELAEGKAAEGPSPEENRRWMVDHGVWGAASTLKRELLERPHRAWTSQEIANGVWRQEALAALVWAIDDRYQLPEYDRQVEPSKLQKRLTRLQVSSGKATIRKAADIKLARDKAEAWLWRSRTTELQKTGFALPEGLTFDQLIRVTAKGFEERGFFRSIDGDFPALQKAYRNLSEEESTLLHSIARERLYAFNWLCTRAADWDSVPTST